MAGNRQQFTLQFNADTTQARKAVESLNASLSKISTINLKVGVNDADLKAASDAARDLQTHLNNAINTSTGQLDLSKFNASIKSSNHSLSDLSAKLLSCGSEGTTAFVNIAQAIGTAQAPIKRVNKLLDNMMTTLKNTVKWELSSTAVHALEGALSSAVSYTKNLNSSLTDIRIVTGQSADDMARFALQANKAAKELSTTTKAYADASLIYYQQGDTQEQAAKKAAITIKAANASFNTSASEMSEYLTAVWNSYQVGADELERYVDIMAALGAKTATSLEEIATSMQKVAATANTVGVSMEQVSSIISTVSSVTRESAESIGTSYKTIFARIGDLKLGGTTDDGVGLGQVSSQLKSIGIEILDASGNLRDMGDIITDLGNKWQTMSEAQKTATAQVVAGKRQYTQLMALFENWDMYNKNLTIAEGSEGELQKMQNVYAESWEAASQRVQASLETIYDSLLNDKVFISLMNVLSDVLEQVDNLIKGFGGMPGILLAIGAVLTKVFGNQMANFIDNIGQKITNLTEKGRLNTFLKSQQELSKVITAQVQDNNTLTDSQRKQIEQTQNIMNMNQKLATSAQNMSNAQITAAQTAIEAYKQESDQIIQTIASAETAANKMQTVISNIEIAKQAAAASSANTLFAGQMGADKASFQSTRIEASSGYGESGQDSYSASTADALGEMEQLSLKFAEVKQTQTELNDLTKNWGKDFTNTEQSVTQLGNTLKEYVGRVFEGSEVQKFSQQIQAAMDANDKQGLYNILVAMNEELAESSTKALFFKEQFIKILQASGQFSDAELNQITAAIDNWATAQAKANVATDQGTTAQQRFAAAIAQQKASLGQAVAALTSFASSVSSLYFGVSNIVSVFGDENKSKLDKFIAVLGVLPGVIRAITASQKLYNTVVGVLKPVADAASTAGSLMAAGGMTTLAAATWAAMTPILPFIALIGALIAVFALLKKAEEDEKKRKEELEKTQVRANEALAKQISAQQEETEANQELLRSFNELYAQKQLGADVDAELAQAAEELAAAYNVTGVAVARLSGDYEELISNVQKYAVVSAGQGMDEARDHVRGAKGQITSAGFTNEVSTWNFNNTDSNNAAFTRLIERGYGGVTSQSTQLRYTAGGFIPYWDLDGGYSATRLALTDDNYGTDEYNAATIKLDRNNDGVMENYTMAEVLGMAATESGTNSLSGYMSTGSSMGLLVSDYDSPEYRIGLYESAQAAIAFMEAHEIGGPLYNGIVKFVADMQDEMDNYYAAMELLATQGKEVLSAKVLGVTEITEYADFETVYDDLYDWVLHNRDDLGIDPNLVGEGLRQEIDKIVSTIIADQTALDDYVIARQAIYEQFATDTSNAETNEANTFYRKMAEEIARRYGPEAITPEVLNEIGNMAIEEGMTVSDAVDAFSAEGSRGQLLISQAQTRKSNEKAMSNYTQVQNAQKLLKENMTGEESLALFHSLSGTGVGWDAFEDAEARLAEYNRFLSMTYQEQQAYFEKITNDALIAMHTNAQTNLTTAQTLYKQANDAYTEFVNSQNMEAVETLHNAYLTYEAEMPKVSFADDGSLQYSGDNAGFNAWVNDAWSRAQANNMSQEEFLANMDSILLQDLSTGNIDLATYVTLLENLNVAESNLSTAEIEAQTAAWNVQNIEINKVKDNLSALASMISNGPGNIEEWNKLAEILGKPITELMSYTESEMAQAIAIASQSVLDHTWSDARARAYYNDANNGLQDDYATYEDWRMEVNSDQTGATIVTDAEYATMVDENRQIQAENATIQFENQTIAMEKSIEIAEEYASILDDLDLGSVASMGAKEWERLQRVIRITKDEFLAMSKLEQIDLIGEKQIEQLNSASIQYSNMAQQAELQRNKFAVGSKEWLEWEEKRLQYIQQSEQLAIDAEQVNQETLEQKAEIYDKNFAKSLQDRSREIEKLKKEAEELKTLTSSLEKGMSSGEISNETMKQMVEKGYGTSSDWYKSAENRAKIVAKATAASYAAEADALLKEQEVYDELNTAWIEGLTDDAALESAFASEAAFKSWIHNLSGLSDEAKAVLSDMWSDINANLDGDFNAAEIREAMKTAFTEAAAEGKMSIEDLASSFRDSYLAIIAEMSAAEQEAAQEACDAWLNAFNLIKEARQGLLSGESLAEQFAGDIDSIYQLMLSSGMDAETFKAGFYGTDMKDNLQLSTWNTQQQLAARGTNLLTDSEGNKHTSWANAYNDWFTQIGGQEALDSIAQTYIDELGREATDADWEDARAKAQKDLNAQFEGEMRDILKTLFPDDTDEQIQERLDKLINGEGWDEVATHLDKFTAAVDLAGDSLKKMAEYDEAKIIRDQAVEAAEAEVAKYQEQAAEQRGYADMAGNMYTRGEASIESVLGETYSPAEYLGVINEALAALGKENVESLDEVNHTMWGELQDYFLTQEQSLLDQAAEAGKKIVEAGEAFATTVKTIFGEDSGSELITSAKKDLEAAEADQEDREEAAAAAEGGSTAASTTRSDYDAQQYGFANKKEWDDYAQRLIDIGEIVDENGEKVTELTDRERQLAAELRRTEKGFNDAEKSLESWTKDLKNADKSSDRYGKALKSMRKAYADIFNLADDDANMLSEAFLESEENAKLLEKAIQGDDDAFNQLQANVAKEITAKIDVSLTGREEVDEFIDYVANYDFGELKVGAKIDDANFNAQLDNMIFNSYDAAAQMSDALSSMGVDATIKEHKVWVPDDPETVTITGSIPIVSPTGVKGYENVSAEVVQQGTGHFETWYTLEGATYNGRGVSRGGSGSDGSGKGGGGGAKPKKLDKKKTEDHKERYHETNQTLERLADELEKVDKLKSRAYGKGHLDAIKQEISLLKQEVGVQADYLRQAKEYLALDRNRVASLGGLFNEDGTISNYDELIDSIIAKYNTFVEKYNAADASAQEKMEEEKEEMDKWFEESMEWITQYEETLNITRDKENEILELQNEISAKALEGIQYKVEFEVELNKEEADFLDYLNEKYSEALEKQDIMVENLVRQQQLAQENLAMLNNAKTELDEKYASGELNQADYVSGLKDINNQILENLSTLEDLRKEIQEAYGNALEMATEAIDNHTEKMEHASSMMQSYISIMGLIGQGVDYQKLSEFYEKQYEYNLNSLKTQQDYLDVLKEEQAYYLAKMAAGELTETERKQFEDLQDTIAEVEEGILSKTEETLSALREAFALTVEGILKGFEESIAGAGNSLEDLAADYEYYLEVQERNVSASKELYEISKLNRQIEQDIADISSSVYKQRLAALQEEIKAKSADRALTEYDIQMMNLEYELLQRQMALEEAKNAKDTVRLTRDSSGNMVYQYTANQDQIAEAQQGVEDVLQRMAEANAERVTQLEQETINTYQNMVSQIEEIANSEVLTQEEKNAKIAEIVARTQEKMSWIQDQYIIATENTASTYELIQEQYGANMADAAQMTKDSMNGTIGEIIAKTNEFAANMSQVQTDVANELALLYQNMDTVLTTTKWDQAAESIKNYDLVIEDAEQDAQKMINTLGGEDGLLDKIKDTTAAWDAQSAAIDALIEYYEKLYQSILKIQQTESTKTPPLPSTPSTTPSTETKTEEKTPTTTEPEDEEANANQVQYQGGSWQFYTYDAASGGKRGAVFHGKNKSPVVTKEDESANRIKISGMDGDGHSFSGSWISKVYKNKELWKAYETGGLVDYTGPAWVDGTKDRPELMLNASDTENMLAAVQTVRSLDTATLTLLDDFIKLATSSMLSANSLHATGVHHTDQELQQQVHITAEFPNVQDSNEIQDAFDNLINRAAQFVGSIKK